MWTSAAFSQKVVRSRAFSDGPQLRLRISSPRQPSRLISSLPCSPRRSAAEAAVQPLFSLQLCGSLIPLHLRRLKSTCIVRNISKLGRLQQAIEILEVRTLEPPPENASLLLKMATFLYLKITSMFLIMFIGSLTIETGIYANEPKNARTHKHTLFSYTPSDQTR